MVLGPVLLLIDLVTGNFTKLKEDAAHTILLKALTAACFKLNAMDDTRFFGSVVQSGFQSAISFITSLPGKALQWGKDFINGIADGIASP